MATPVVYHPVLVLLPPREFARRVNPFRRSHDKAGTRWTTHITLAFPSVDLPTELPETIATLREAVKDIQPFALKLDKVDRFSMSGYETVHLTVAQEEDQRDVQRLWKILAKALNYTNSGRPFVPHVTLGQGMSKGKHLDALKLLNLKANRILESIRDIEWIVGSIVVLQKDVNDEGIMKLYDEIFLSGQTESAYQLAPVNPTARLDSELGWCWDDSTTAPIVASPARLSVATYNILHDAQFPFASRSKRIEEDIVGANADILCLQEVSDESLPLLFGSPRIRAIYKHSSRHPNVVLETERSILILSRYPFTATLLETGTRHKPAVIATFNLDGPKSRPLVVASIHLTAGRGESLLEQKREELSAVLKHLSQKHSNADWVIAGDLNWPNELEEPPTDELFEDAGAHDNDSTYDPTRNFLAANTAVESKTGQRYDRIFFRRHGHWALDTLERFGINDEPASDHWGLKAVLAPAESEPETSAGKDEEVADSFSSFVPESSITDGDLDASLQGQGWLPSEEREQTMERVVQLLRDVICPPATVDPERASGVNQPPQVILRLEPVGSYALGVHTSDSDIDCLVVGNISPKTFWMLARSHIRARQLKAGADGTEDFIKLRRFVKDAAVQMMELEAYGIKVDLQYCAAAALAERWEVSTLPRDSPLLHLPVASLVTLNAYRDVLTLKNMIPSLENFRLAHRSLKLFLVNRGLWGSRFGYLGGFHLTLLLTRVALSIHPSSSSAALVEAFLRTYAAWDWSKDMVYPIPSRTPVGSSTSYKRVLSKEPMVVLSIERPLSNLTYHASVNSVQTLSRGFKHAFEELVKGVSWANVCAAEDALSKQDLRGPGALGVFLANTKLFVKMDVHFWGRNDMKGRALLGWLESRIVNFLVLLHQTVPEVVARFWPQRLVDQSSVDAASRDPNGFYLFGLSPADTNRGADAPSRRNADVQAALLSAARSFEHDLQSNDRYYDHADTYISLTLVKLAQLPSSVILDPFQWQDQGFDAPQEEEDEEAAEATPASIGTGETEPEMEQDRWESYKIPSSSERKRAAAAAKPKTTHVRGGKLRTSSDVYNRLIWDSTDSVAKDEYIIGYEDRFTGIKETPLTAWKREVEDESFIPFHRVVYFKRRGDGVNVWDRRTKVDLVFGSGVGAI